MSNPYGQNPYGQQPPPGGPQPGYGPQGPGPQGPGMGGPGMGPGPQGPGMGPGPGMPNQGPPFYGQQPPRRRGGKFVFKIIGGVVVLALVIVGFVLSQNDPDHAKAGDCMKGHSKDDLEITKCSSSDATYKVLKKFDDTSDTQKCQSVQGAEVGFYEIKKHDRFVLCLKSI